LQKFGLDNLRSEKLGSLEFEIVEDQASALGRAGDKLKTYVELYRAEKEELFPKHDEDILLQQISDATYDLLVQREFIGFMDGNLEWIQKCYEIPQEAINRLGTKMSSHNQLTRRSNSLLAFGPSLDSQSCALR
jgi:hypothetical protein